MHSICLVYSTQHYRKYIFASIQIIAVIVIFARRNDICALFKGQFHSVNWKMQASSFILGLITNAEKRYLRFGQSCSSECSTVQRSRSSMLNLCHTQLELTQLMICVKTIQNIEAYSSSESQEWRTPAEGAQDELMREQESLVVKIISENCCK